MSEIPSLPLDQHLKPRRDGSDADDWNDRSEEYAD